MALSKYIQDFSRKIEQTSATELSSAQQCTAPPRIEWIPENQIKNMSVINLRTAEDTQNAGSVMKLQQFNPSFFLKSSEVYCRFPGCSSTTHRLKPTINSSEEIKQDLFLCQTHRKKLISVVSERCAKENVVVNSASYSYKDFCGYTHLIGQLEKAFVYITKESSTVSRSYDSTLAEVFLNTRNFLIITNAFLNPDDDNTKTVLPSIMALVNEILGHLKDPELVENLLNVLREVMNTILQFFGIIYEWVFLGNPGAQVGAGVGIVAGFLGVLRFAASPFMTIASTVISFIAGKLIGGGSYERYRENQYIEIQKKKVQEYDNFKSVQIGSGERYGPLFHVQASTDGDLLFNPKPNI